MLQLQPTASTLWTDEQAEEVLKAYLEALQKLPAKPQMPQCYDELLNGTPITLESPEFSKDDSEWDLGLVYYPKGSGHWNREIRQGSPCAIIMKDDTLAHVMFIHNGETDFQSLDSVYRLSDLEAGTDTVSITEKEE